MRNNKFIALLSEYFTSYLPDVKGLSPNSITSYQYAFQLLFEYMQSKKGKPAEKVTFKCLDFETVTGYLAWLEAERGCSAATRNFRRTALSSFAKFALKSSDGDALTFYSNMVSIPRKKVTKEAGVKYFTKDEIEILLATPDTKTPIGRRNSVLMSVLYASGARAQELCDITVNDVCWGANTNIRLNGKGGKPRLVTLPENCAKLLQSFIISRGLDRNSPQDRLRHVFSSQTREKMSVACVESIVKKYVSQAKAQHSNLFQQKQYSPHSFRHSIAVHMLECGESLIVIKSFLGHASITTTTVYASITPELANKYLRERGVPIEAALSNTAHADSSLPSTLSFLKAKRK